MINTDVKTSQNHWCIPALPNFAHSKDSPIKVKVTTELDYSTVWSVTIMRHMGIDTPHKSMLRSVLMITYRPKAISILYILLSETEFVIWSINFFPVVFSGLVWPRSNFQSGSSLAPGRRRNGLAAYASCSNKATLQNTYTSHDQMIEWAHNRSGMGVTANDTIASTIVMW